MNDFHSVMLEPLLFKDFLSNPSLNITTSGSILVAIEAFSFLVIVDKKKKFFPLKVIHSRSDDSSKYSINLPLPQIFYPSMIKQTLCRL